MDGNSTKLAVNDSTWVIEPAVLNSVGVLEYNCILLWFLFYESKMDQN